MSECKEVLCDRDAKVGNYCIEHRKLAKRAGSMGGDGASSVASSEKESDSATAAAVTEEKKCPVSGCGAKLTKKGKCRSCSARNRKKKGEKAASLKPVTTRAETPYPMKEEGEKKVVPSIEAWEPSTEIEKKIVQECVYLRDMLLDKNRKYGNSALEPRRVFSKADPEEQLLVRIDDKISRIEQGEGDDDEDAITDLIGYLVLLKIARRHRDVGQGL